MSLPRNHQRRLHRRYGFTYYCLWLLRTPRLDVAPPARCRTRLLAALAAGALGSN